MTASEIRIGNFIESYVVMDNGQGIISSPSIGAKKVDLQLLTFIHNANGLATYRGIVLTPDILEKVGFVLNTFNEYQIPIDNRDISCVPKKLYFSGDYLYLEEWRDGVRSDKRDIITIWNKDVMKFFYLHSLQNLYHSLTGVELTINL